MDNVSSKGAVLFKEKDMLVLEDLFIRPFFDESRIEVSFTCPDDVEKVEYEIIADKDTVVEKDVSLVRAGKVFFEQKIDNFKSWSTDDPFLYILKLRLRYCNGVFECSKSFGMKKIHVQGSRIYFNNMPFYIRGVIRGRKGHEHPNLMSCSEREYHEKNIVMTKAFGFNFVRFHSVIPEEEFLDAADKLGILLHVEIRNYYGKYQSERESTGFDDDQELVNEDDWEKVILKLRNHPSVMVYCMGNEISTPGNNERVKIIRDLTKKLDPTRLFLDSCSRGEYDRDTVDLDVQHMGYYAPFGKHNNMFEDSSHLSIYGSIHNKSMTLSDNEDNPKYIMRREIPVKFPLLAHEVCHYITLRDPYILDKKFKKYDSKKPWWIDELIKMIDAKGHKKQYQKMLKASTNFQYIWLKQALECIRRSPLLTGFHFLQLSDTNDYENANGLLDCFDDIKDISPDSFLQFNGPVILVADLPKRTFMEGTRIEVPIILSQYSSKSYKEGVLTWKILDKKSNSILMEGKMGKFDLTSNGLHGLCRIEIQLPKCENAKSLTFTCKLLDENQDSITKNSWDIWLFPDKPERIKSKSIINDLKNVNLNKRYSLSIFGGSPENTPLLLAERLDDKVLDHLDNGGDVFLMYRIEENRSKTAPKEKYYLPSTWDRFKPVIWDRGHNCGGFLRDSDVLGSFPHNGYIDWQFYNLIEDCDKIDLSDFPVKIEPIIEGIDKAVRDRYDVGRFDLSEFQYEYTMRKFAYMFELKVGAGRMFVTGMNFKGIEADVPEACWMFESIMNYLNNSSFDPKCKITVEQLKDYLECKGKSKRIKERMMTQYWQINNAPLESAKYWKESEQWLRQND